MQITFVRDNIIKEVDEGAVVTVNYNETLDSAIVNISNLDSSLDIEPFDKVILYDDMFYDIGSTFYMCIDTYHERMICNNPVTYNYEIHCFSETKLLEGIVLPNVSITPIRDDTYKRSIYYYIDQYLKEYARNKGWTVSTGARNRFSSIICPELQWSMPTLREVLNDLMMVDDCIVTLKNGVIDYIDISVKKKSIHSSMINYLHKSQSSADYISELQMNMVNVLQTKQTDVDNTVNTLETQTFTTDGYLLKDTNLRLQVEYPILRIKSCKILFTMSKTYYIGGQTRTLYYQEKTDIAWLIKEKAEYDTLKVYYQNFYTDQPDFDEWDEYQLFSLYYNRYGNEISDFTPTKRIANPWWSSSWVYLIELKKNLLRNSQAFDDWYNSTPQYGDTKEQLIETADYDYISTFFEIEYETTADQMFRASKSIRNNNKNRNSRVVIDNQTNAFVDAKTQGHLEYQKANRLGNQQININQRFLRPSSFSSFHYPLLGVGDYLDKETYELDGDAIVYQVQYQCFEEHIEVNAIATKDYLMKDYFTGVKSKVRTWVNAKDEAFVRHDLDKYYLEFSKTSKVDASVTLNYNLTYFLSPISLINYAPLQYALCRIRMNLNDQENYTYLPAVGMEAIADYSYAKNMVGRIIGNSLVFTFGFDDNCVAGKYADLNDDIVDGGRPLQFYKYCDDNNEFDRIWFYLANSRNISSSSPTDFYKQPKVYNGFFNVILSDEMELHKDNKEITRISLQLEFCTDTNDIMFTDDFLTFQTFIYNGIRNTSIKIYQWSAVNSSWVLTNRTLSFSSNKTIISGDISDGDEFKLVDEETGKELMRVKNTLEFYLNILKYRN